MQHRIAFVEPARLTIDEIDDRVARQRGDTVLNCVGTDAIDGSRAKGIEQRALVVHGDGGARRFQRQLGFKLDGQIRANLDGIGERRKKPEPAMRMLYTPNGRCFTATLPDSSVE